MLHVYLFAHVVRFLLKMVKAALSEVSGGTELETIKATRSLKKNFEGEVRELQLKIERQ